MNKTPVNPKRQRAELSPDTDASPDLIDLKKAKVLLSISDSESNLDTSVCSSSVFDNMMSTPVAITEGGMDPAAQKECEDIFAKLDASLQIKLVTFKNEIVEEIKSTLGHSISKLEGITLKLELDHADLKKEVQT
jgi:hypothetical protein